MTAVATMRSVGVVPAVVGLLAGVFAVAMGVSGGVASVVGAGRGAQSVRRSRVACQTGL